MKTIDNKDDLLPFLEERRHKSITKNNGKDIITEKRNALISDKYIDEFCDDQSISEEDFIDIIAYKRSEGYSRASGGGNANSENAIKRDYSINPWKFVEEFLQNADDCAYLQTPALEIIINEDESYVEFVYNEVGFSRKDIWALTAFAQSAKHESFDLINSNDNTINYKNGLNYFERTGRKGIGFKSVFTFIDDKADNVIVSISSNGFAFDLNGRIGSIIPIWNSDYLHNDNKTHVRVSFVDPHFDNSGIYQMKYVYEKLKELFCIDLTKGEVLKRMFCSSPILYMRSVKKIGVSYISRNEKESFSTSLECEKTKYENRIKGNDKMLSCIFNDGFFYEREIADCTVSISDNNTELKIDILRLTVNRKLNDICRNFSVLAPVMVNDEPFVFTDGALFRTFSLSDNTFELPISIDAPFELNQKRSGVLYSSSEYNTSVADTLFKENNILEQLFMLLRTIKGIRIDLYLHNDKAKIFNNDDNNDFMQMVEIGKELRKLPLLRTYNSVIDYVDYSSAKIFDKDIYNWPCFDALAKIMLGEEKSNRVLASIYEIKSNANISASKLNAYLDIVEQELGIDSEEMFSFVKSYLYPYIGNNKEKMLRNLGSIRLLFSKIHTTKGEIIKRESYNDVGDRNWYHCNDGKLSIGSVRIWESSPVDNSMIYKIIEKSKRNIYIFGKKLGKDSKWEDIKQEIEAIGYYNLDGRNTAVASFGCTLSEKYLPERNLFREYGILETIPDEDINCLSRYYKNDEKKVVDILIQLGIARASEYFNNDNGHISLSQNAISLFKSIKPSDISYVWDNVFNSAFIQEHSVEIKFEEVKDINKEMLVRILKDKKIFNTDNLITLADKILANVENNSIIDCIVIIAALSIAKKKKYEKQITLDIENAIRYKVVKILSELTSKSISITIQNNNYYKEIPENEIAPLINTFNNSTDISDKHFYRGKICKPARPFCLVDSSCTNIFLNVDEKGDYTNSLVKGYLEQKIDYKKISALKEMKAGFEKVYESIIRSELDSQDGDINETFNSLKANFRKYNKTDIISIISWFRYSGSSKAAGNSANAMSNDIKRDYEKDPWRFVYEFIQNVDDCIFENKGSNKLDISISDKGIVFEYNEVGFSIDDILSLTSFDDSTKNETICEINGEGVVINSKTGRKGRGFKSVFALPGENLVVKIWSNGFSFKFFKCLGIIIPVWNDEAGSVSGTKISIEGVDSKDCKKIATKLDQFLGIKNIESVFACCPVLFLRNINRIALDNYGKYSAIEVKLDDSHRHYYDTMTVPDECIIKGCIRSSGEYYKYADEAYSISVQKNNSSPIMINARKHTKSFIAFLKEKPIMTVISVMYPEMKLDDEICFTKGALYHTLPLSGEIFDLPLAINAEFETNNDRSDLKDDNSEQNSYLISSLDSVITGAYEKIKLINNINICNYFKKTVSILNKLKYVGSFSISELIKEIPLFKNELGEFTVSYSSAITMPEEMRTWPEYAHLASSFGVDSKNLISREYYSKDKNNAKLFKEFRVISIDFVDHINAYINIFDNNISMLTDYCNNMLYPFLSKYFDELLKEYRSHDQKPELGNLRIFPVKTNDGEIVLDSIGNKESVWFDDASVKVGSFGVFRNIQVAVTNYEEHKKWIKEIAGCAGIEIYDEVSKVFSLSVLKRKRNDFDWNWTKSIIEAMFYYDVASNSKINIAGLDSCVIDNSLSHEDNIFCTAAKELGHCRFIKHIITEDDLIEIICDMDKADLEPEDIIQVIKDKNTIRPDSFFEKRGDNYALNEKTKRLLQEYCTTFERSDRVVREIAKCFSEKNTSIELVIRYEEIKECDPVVFISILNSSGLISDHYKGRMALEYYDNNCKNAKSIIQIAALLKSYEFCKKEIKEETTINVKLSDVIKHKLGSLLPKGNKNKLTVNVELDIDVEPYNSKQISEVMSWIADDESAENVEVKHYYIADISAAFDDGKTAHFIVANNDSVIFNKDDENEALLQYAKSLNNENPENIDVAALLDIAVEKEKLLAWEKTNESKKKFIETLSKYRKKNQRMLKILTSKNIERDSINSTSRTLEYLFAELLQNINDCVFNKGDMQRVLYITFDIQQGSMKLQYNEKGFDYHNVYSITGLGQSTKHDKSEGEKGLGFKKVFTLFDKVNILSNDFFFTLSKSIDEYTEIKWDEGYKNDYKSGSTTMVFHTKEINRLKDLEELIEKMLGKDFIDLPISPIFLENISEYVLTNRNKTLTREEIKKEYIYYEYPIVSTYRRLINSENVENGMDHLQEYKSELMKRRKYEELDEAESRKIIDSLSFTLCIPKKFKKKTNNYIFSTLPTEDLSGMGMDINIPLELTTGRDHVAHVSDYNKAILSMIFGNEHTYISMLGFVLSEIAEINPDLEIWKILPYDATAYKNTYNLEDEKVYADIKLWKVFHEYKTKKMTCLDESYSVEEILYKYYHTVKPQEICFDIKEWLEEKYPHLCEFSLIDLAPGDYGLFTSIIKSLNALDCKDELIYKPFKDEQNNIPINYFIDEYSITEEEV